MKKSILSFVIAAAIAPIAQNAAAQNPQTAPASVTEAQHSAKIAASNYHAALDTFNRAPASEREYAAQKLDTATNAYQTAVLKEKVAIKQWLTPPTEDRAPAPAPHVQHFSEPQNIAVPTLIAPQAAPTAVPVSSGYREPQNVVVPTVIAPQAAPTATPVSTGYREPQNVVAPAAPVINAPKAQDDSWKYNGETAAKYQNEVAAKYQNEVPAHKEVTDRIAGNSNSMARANTLGGRVVAHAALIEERIKAQDAADAVVAAAKAANDRALALKNIEGGRGTTKAALEADAAAKGFAPVHNVTVLNQSNGVNDVTAAPAQPGIQQIPTQKPTVSATLTPTVIAPNVAPQAIPQPIATTVVEPTLAPVAVPPAVPTKPAAVVAPTVVAPYIAPQAKPDFNQVQTTLTAEPAPVSVNVPAKPVSTVVSDTQLPAGGAQLPTDAVDVVVLTNDHIAPKGTLSSKVGPVSTSTSITTVNGVTTAVQTVTKAGTIDANAPAGAPLPQAAIPPVKTVNVVPVTTVKPITAADIANAQIVSATPATPAIVANQQTPAAPAATPAAPAAVPATPAAPAVPQPQLDLVSKQTGINKQDIATNAQGIAANTQRIDTVTYDLQGVKSTGEAARNRANQAFANAEANRKALDHTNQKVAANTRQLANHEGRIQSLETKTAKGFSDLKRQIDDNKHNANAGIAGVAAMANIPQVTDTQQFSFGAGVGARGDEQAVAVGFSARVSENVVTKAAISTDTQDGFTIGAGVAYGF